MKAIKIIDNVIRYIEDANIPTLTPQFNVLVKVHYAGICRTDIGVANGAINHKDTIILGHEFCGTIEKFYNGETEFECFVTFPWLSNSVPSRSVKMAA